MQTVKLSVENYILASLEGDNDVGLDGLEGTSMDVEGREMRSSEGICMAIFGNNNNKEGTWSKVGNIVWDAEGGISGIGVAIVAKGSRKAGKKVSYADIVTDKLKEILTEVSLYDELDVELLEYEFTIDGSGAYPMIKFLN
ncbi:hypothetical protein V6N13_080360 [Hibiscus sabdariffa]|uniref:Uncharacterized protein n=1 Tax=Hibiscus sabdariffa TaxID=183260 RepID=A0ABR2PY40_9ROSI